MTLYRSMRQTTDDTNKAISCPITNFRSGLPRRHKKLMRLVVNPIQDNNKNFLKIKRH